MLPREQQQELKNMTRILEKRARPIRFVNNVYVAYNLALMMILIIYSENISNPWRVLFSLYFLDIIHKSYLAFYKKDLYIGTLDFEIFFTSKERKELATVVNKHPEFKDMKIDNDSSVNRILWNKVGNVQERLENEENSLQSLSVYRPGFFKICNESQCLPLPPELQEMILDYALPPLPTRN